MNGEPYDCHEKPADPEELCEECDEHATRLEPRPNHWHDSIWCDEHARGKSTEPLSGLKPRGLWPRKP